MSTINTKATKIYTHEGAPAKRISPEQQLRRSVMCCMLWERSFYEDGESIASRIESLVPMVSATIAMEIAIEAKEKMKLRHVPLFIAVTLFKTGLYKEITALELNRLITRPDDMTEFLAMYWREGKKPVPALIKKTFGIALNNFDAYQLAKYNRKKELNLKDVISLCHPIPKDDNQSAIFKKILTDSLEPPLTWEVEISRKDDVPKKEKWLNLLNGNRLGALAFLRNLRNMLEEDISISLIEEKLKELKTNKVLPFQFIAAAVAAPALEPYLEKKMLEAINLDRELEGLTILLIDVSGSMDEALSSRSQMTRRDAATGLAMILREICERPIIKTFSNMLVTVPPRRGFALRDVINDSQEHRTTLLGGSLEAIRDTCVFDRLIVITDEQGRDSIPNIKHKKKYMINISTNANGIGYYDWIHIDGWSEHVVNFIIELEGKTGEKN